MLRMSHARVSLQPPRVLWILLAALPGGWRAVEFMT